MPPQYQQSSRIPAVFGLIILVALLLSACGKPSNPSADITTVTSPPVPSGIEFEDPDGKYEIVVSHDWERIDFSIASEEYEAPDHLEGWFVGPGINDLSNVNIVTEQIPTGMNITAYVAATIRHFDSVSGFDLTERQFVRGHDGQQLAMIEFFAHVEGERAQYLVVLGTSSTTAAAVTLTALPENFVEVADEVSPYMLSLQVTS